MIDPIRSIGPALLDRSESARSSSPRAKKESQAVSDSSSPAKKIKSNTDVIALSFDIKGDLETLQKSVEAVFEKVRSQLERTFGIRGGKGDDTEFLPPEDASADEVLEFFSPENTAKRIVGFSTGFVDAFLKSHGDRSDEENIEEFTKLITKGIKNGFAQAEAILGDTQELGDVGQNIKKTYELVLQGIQEFRQEFIRKNKPVEDQLINSEEEFDAAVVQQGKDKSQPIKEVFPPSGTDGDIEAAQQNDVGKPDELPLP